MVLPRVRLLVSSVSHLPLHTVFRASGVTRKHGFDLEPDIVNVPQGNKPVRKFSDRVPALLSGEYEFLSGLHHETYVCRARGEKRLVYLAQTQNDWDNRLIARPEIQSPKQLAPHSHAAKVFINWLLSREGQTAYQTILAKVEGIAPDSLRIDIPKDDVALDERRVSGVSYLDVDTPERRDMRPIFKLLDETLAESRKK